MSGWTEIRKGGTEAITYDGDKKKNKNIKNKREKNLFFFDFAGKRLRKAILRKVWDAVPTMLRHVVVKNKKKSIQITLLLTLLICQWRPYHTEYTNAFLQARAEFVPQVRFSQFAILDFCSHCSWKCLAIASIVISSFAGRECCDSLLSHLGKQEKSCATGEKMATLFFCLF